MQGGGRQSRLIARLLGRLRGDNHQTLINNYSMTSTACSTCDSTAESGRSLNDEEEINDQIPTASTVTDEDRFAANIDLRYGGQYLTPEQLPEFCDQLHNLVEVIRNIQSYAKVTGEYPSELEKRLEQEAREVAALAGEARHARDVLDRTRAQHRALRALRQQLATQLATLRHTEIRELESLVRVSDRKLYKTWESLKDSSNPSAFEPLLDEVRSKQTALECLLRLINNRRTSLSRSTVSPQPLPAPQHDDEDSSTTNGSARKRYDGSRRTVNKRRKKETAREPRSVPLSEESSRHETNQQVYVDV